MSHPSSESVNKFYADLVHLTNSEIRHTLSIAVTATEFIKVGMLKDGWSRRLAEPENRQYVELVAKRLAISILVADHILQVRELKGISARGIHKMCLTKL